MPHAIREPNPSIHESIWEPPAAFADDDFVKAAKSALTAARVAAEAAHQIALATHDDPMLTEAAQHKSTRDQVVKVSKPAMQKIDAATERLAKKIASLQQFLIGPPPPKDATTVSDIRRALAAMPPPERRKAVLSAIEAGDDLTCAAVLRAPGFVCGFTDTEVVQFRETWGQRHRAAETNQLREIQTAADHLERGGKLLLSYTTSLYSTFMLEEAEKRSKRTAAATAAASTAVH